MKHLNDKSEKPISRMTRPELIYQLSRHAHQAEYGKVCNMPTMALQRLLAWYTGQELPEHKGRVSA